MLPSESRKENVQKGTIVGRHDSSKRGAGTRSSSPTLKLQTKNDEKKFFGRQAAQKQHCIREVAPEAVQRLPQKELAQIRRVIRDTLPCVKMTDHQQAASLARSVRSFTRRRTNSR